MKILLWNVLCLFSLSAAAEVSASWTQEQHDAYWTEERIAKSEEENKHRIWLEHEKINWNNVDALIADGRAVCTALSWSISSGYRKLTRRLLQAGADPNKRGTITYPADDLITPNREIEGNPPLLAASHNIYILKLLLTYGADPNLINSCFLSWFKPEAQALLNQYKKRNKNFRQWFNVRDPKALEQLTGTLLGEIVVHEFTQYMNSEPNNFQAMMQQASGYLKQKINRLINPAISRNW